MKNKMFNVSPAGRAESIANFTSLLGVSAREAELAVRSQIATPQKAAGVALSVKALEGDDSAVEMFIYDEIGPEWAGLIGATTVARALQENADKKIRLRINSPGGSVFEGLAIYNLLLNHAPGVESVVDGLAASAASFVAMAGGKIGASKASMLMIHDAWGVMIGNSQDAMDFAALLDKIDGQIAGIYAKKSGRKEATFRKMMDSDTWLTADEAMENRLIDEVLDVEPVKSGFDLSRFESAPADRLAALANTEPVVEEELAPKDTDVVALRMRLLELDGAA